MRVAKILVLLVLIGVGLYVRLAPSDPMRWHAMPDTLEEGDLRYGAVRIVGVGQDGLLRIHAIIVKSPRTQHLAGSVDEGMITYISRSRVVGFPDYTTVRHTEQQLQIFGRQRFGTSDFGVNAGRIDEWLRLLLQGG